MIGGLIEGDDRIRHGYSTFDIVSSCAMNHRSNLMLRVNNQLFLDCILYLFVSFYLWKIV